MKDHDQSGGSGTAQLGATQRAEGAVLFMEELLNSVESLCAIAEEHGPMTLADLMYLQHSILTGGFIDHYPESSKAAEIVGNLPSAKRWSEFIKVEYLQQRHEGELDQVHGAAGRSAGPKPVNTVTQGLFSGPVLSVADGVITQRINRAGETVNHDASTLSEIPAPGSVVEIHYREGRGHVSGKGPDKGIGR